MGIESVTQMPKKRIMDLIFYLAKVGITKGLKYNFS